MAVNSFSESIIDFSSLSFYLFRLISINWRRRIARKSYWFEGGFKMFS